MTELTTLHGTACVAARNPAGAPWLYLQIRPEHGKLRHSLHVEVHALSSSGKPLWIEYDSTDKAVEVVGGAPGAFKRTSVSPTIAGRWTVHRFDLPDLVRSHRINGSDLRIVCADRPDSALFIAAVAVSSQHQPIATGAADETDSRLTDLIGSLKFDPPTQPDISIIIPFLDRANYTLQCLAALSLAEETGFEVILVDDGSRSAEVARLEGVQGIRLVRCGEHRGHAGACNLGARAARGEWLVFLDNDTIPCRGWLSALLDCASRHPDAAAVGAKLLYPGTGVIQHAGIGFDASGLPCNLGRHHRDEDPKFNREVVVAAVTGACLLTPRRLFESAGGFDEGYANGLEDVDYCLRVQQSRNEIVYCPDSVLYHYESVSDDRYRDRQESNRARFHGRWAALTGESDAGESRRDLLTRIRDTLHRSGPGAALDFLDGAARLPNPTDTLDYFRRLDRNLVFLLRSYLLLRNGDPGEAMRCVGRIADNLSDHRERSLFEELFLVDPDPNRGRFAEVSRRRATPTESERIAVYTVLVGAYDDLPPVLTHSDLADFVCFTDQDVDGRGWVVRPIRHSGLDDVVEAKQYKLFPWRFLEGYDYSMYVDANTLLFGNIDRLIQEYLLGNDFVGWGHPHRCDVFAECLAIIALRKFDPSRLMAQLRHYRGDGLGADTGLIEASFLWRRHDSEPVRKLMDAWWRHITRFTSRDQVSLGHLMSRGHLRPRIMPGQFGSSRVNEWFEKTAHAPARRTRSAPRHRPRSCRMVYAADARLAGSTVMRCFQASEILRRHDTTLPIVVTTGMDACNSLVILSKSVLQCLEPEQLTGLRKRGNIVFADFIDAPVNPEIVGLVDGLIASSISAYRDYLRLFPNVAVVHLTHTTDPRLPDPAPSRGFTAAYFGELTNTLDGPRIRQQVDMVAVDTSTQDTEWLNRVTAYRCHYAVRRSPRPEGHKPFLKGFTAARYGAPVIVDSENTESRHYLGPDYPFIVDAGSEESVVEGILSARDAFGGSDWQDAVERMRHVRARSDHAWYCREFKALLKSLG